MPALDRRSTPEVVAAFARAGAHVSLDPEGENLIRREGGRWVVHAQGLPNLIHELVHFVGSGRLDDDYGFPYAEIPLDLDRAGHRALLWEELACCGMSVAAADEPAAWFAEQLEILPVFYGEESWSALRARVEDALRAHRAEFETRWSALAARVEALTGRGTPPSERFWSLWEATRS